MHWRLAGGCVLISMTCLGCAQTFGKSGTLARALDEDQKALLETGRSTNSVYLKFCAGGREATEQCRWAMENPEEAEALMLEEEE